LPSARSKAGPGSWVSALWWFLRVVLWRVWDGDIAQTRILEELLNLSYSREQEAEADDYSVRYLADTEYACHATASFFANMLAAGDNVNIPAFLSDHPDSQSRVQDIRAKAQELGCSTEPAAPDTWQAFQASLPQGTGDEQ
jgi:predicted Zn-dependent protease